MNLIALDTSGPVAGCAVMKDGKVIHSVAMNFGLTHSETIMPAIDRALFETGMSIADMDCVATVAGPGSFTGVRIGICAAKGLAHAIGKPCASVDALEALALNCYGFDGLCCPILDARRSQVYCAAFDMKAGFPKRVMEDDAIALSDFLDKLPADRRLIFVGDGVPVHEKTIRERLPEALIAPEHLRSLKPESVAVLASERQEDWMPSEALKPIYLRLSQAERERNAKLAKEAEA